MQRQTATITCCLRKNYAAAITTIQAYEHDFPTPSHYASSCRLGCRHADCRSRGGEHRFRNDFQRPLGNQPYTQLRAPARPYHPGAKRSEEHTSELQSLMRISYAVFCLKKQKKATKNPTLIIIYSA